MKENSPNQQSIPEGLRKEFEKETITSLLDLDLYKLTMGQFAWDHFADTSVTYDFVNRTKHVLLSKEVPIDVLQTHFKQIKNLHFTDTDIEYLRTIEVQGIKIFKEGYLQSLKHMHLPDISISEKDGQYAIQVKGKWSEAIYWETLILSTVNELYYRKLQFDQGLTEKTVHDQGVKRFEDKMKLLHDYIKEEEEAGREGPYIMDFGTRRRFSGRWQEEVVARAAKALGKNFIGTSNVRLGQQLDIPVKGTLAHEMDMIFSGIYHEEDDRAGTFISHDKMMNMWYEEYGKSLSVALTDTYGDEFFFNHFTKEQANDWIGLRQDSGDPVAFGNNALAFYKKMGIDPKEKTLIFSDGLTAEEIIRIHKQFSGKVKMIFGWGTTLTNDVGFPTLSLVVKATEANGYGTAKLSNNIAKAVGRLADIMRAKRFVGYQSTYDKQPQV